MWFRRKLDKEVNAYCDSCYGTTKHDIEVTKNLVNLHCTNCEGNRHYQRIQIRKVHVRLPELPYQEHGIKLE